MRALTTKFTSSLKNTKLSHPCGLLSAVVLTICLASIGGNQLMADPLPPEEPVIISFSAFEMFEGEWELTGQVVNHDGINTTVNFGDYLSGESTTTDALGFFVHYCSATGGETVSASATCIYGTSEDEFVTLE